MANLSSLIQQLPGGPAVAAPVAPSNGARVYCGVAQVVTSGVTTSEVAVPFTLTGLSTVNVQIRWSFTNDTYTSTWYVDGPGMTVTSPNPAPAGSFRAVSTAVTRGAGDYTVTANAVDVGSGVLTVVVVIGGNTGADCVEYA